MIPTPRTDKETQERTARKTHGWLRRGSMAGDVWQTRMTTQRTRWNVTTPPLNTDRQHHTMPVTQNGRPHIIPTPHQRHIRTSKQQQIDKDNDQIRKKANFKKRQRLFFFDARFHPSTIIDPSTVRKNKKATTTTTRRQPNY